MTVVKSLYEAGADGITMFNNSMGLEIDIETQSPLFKGTNPTVLMPEGLTLPHTLYYTALTRLTGIEVGLSASFGVWVWSDIIKCIMCGADTVQTCRRVMTNGFGIATDWLEQVSNWMENKGFKSLQELKGRALDNFVDIADIPKEVAVERGGVPSLVAVLNSDKCINCSLCEKVCFYFAILREDNGGKIYVARDKCHGCGLCVGICSEQAIILEERAHIR
jgi:Pyruvate/2-oxoacid:ferredoxin oxidoreductase delta subunit